MRASTTAGVVWWFLAVAVSVSAQIRSETQVDLTQGRLERVLIKVVPEAQAEARAWWSPQMGGAGWLRWYDFQVGPLAPISSPEGLRSWGPATGLGPGHWGVAYDANPWGAWAVQKPTTYELGLQGRGQWGNLASAAGLDRRWALDPSAGAPLWTDEARWGVGWKSRGVEAATQAAGSWWEGGERQLSAHGRVGVDLGHWEGRIRAGWAEREPWELTVGGGWESGGLRLSGSWNRLRGPQALTSVELRALQLVWEARADLRSGQGEVASSGGLGVRDVPGHWALRWDLRPTPDGLQNQWAFRCKGSDWEAQADWHVTGRPLGWIGPGAEFSLSLRWFSP